MRLTYSPIEVSSFQSINRSIATSPSWLVKPLLVIPPPPTVSFLVTTNTPRQGEAYFS